MKCLTIIGARPQFIKVASVSRALSESFDVQEILLHTGQHYDKTMSEVFFSELDIQKPSYNLHTGSGSHGQQTGKMLVGIEDVLILEKPNFVIVYGDTNSTLAGALAAAKMHIPVVHIEAGLRSFNRKMPEEVNRVLTDHLSDILYTPTDVATGNLLNEGIDKRKVIYVGDVMYDAAKIFSDHALNRRTTLKSFELSPNDYILATVHRAENTNDRLKLLSIFKALIRVAATLPVVLPLHPRTRSALEAIDMLSVVSSKLKLLPPVGYLDMLNLEKNARLIVTDSGGVQKEAFFQRVPCVTLREETEWIELINSGWNYLIAPSTDEAICEGITSALKRAIPAETQLTENLYGGGEAAYAISTHLQKTFC